MIGTYRLSDFRTASYRIAALSFFGTAVGIIASLCTIAFVDSVFFLNDLLLVSPRSRIQHEDSGVLLVAATLLVPTIGGLAVGLMIKHWVDGRQGLGPADSILAVQLNVPSKSLRSGLASTFAAILSLGAGASVGQYGPLVYLGTMIGNLFCRFRVNLPGLRSICIAAGVAAAIATAFNAPLAGLVFAHEVILRHYAIRAFAPTTVAAAIGYFIASVVFERPPLFVVKFDAIQHGHEYLLFAVVGVLSAVIAFVIVRSLVAVSGYVRRSRIPFAMRPMIAGLILGAIALQLPDVLGIGQETLRFATIDGAFGTGELALILVTKIFLTVLCLGFGFAGGIFSPVLLIGILFGALFGNVIGEISIFENSGIVPYAICGMMAVTSAVIGAPLTTILIVLELTRNYDLITAAMVAVVFSNLVSYRIYGRSMYDLQISRRGYDFASGTLNATLSQTRVIQLIHDKYLVVHPDETIVEAAEKLNAGGHSTGIVTTRDNVYLGMIHLQAFADAAPSDSVASIVDASALAFDEFISVRWAMEWLTDFVGDYTPVVAHENRQLLGVVSEGNIIECYLEASHRLTKEEHDSV